MWEEQGLRNQRRRGLCGLEKVLNISEQQKAEHRALWSCQEPEGGGNCADSGSRGWAVMPRAVLGHQPAAALLYRNHPGGVWGSACLLLSFPKAPGPRLGPC